MSRALAERAFCKSVPPIALDCPESSHRRDGRAADPAVARISLPSDRPRRWRGERIPHEGPALLPGLRVKRGSYRYSVLILPQVSGIVGTIWQSGFVPEPLLCSV